MLDVSIRSMLLTGCIYEETEKETMPSLIVNVVEVFSLSFATTAPQKIQDGFFRSRVLMESIRWNHKLLVSSFVIICRTYSMILHFVYYTCYIINNSKGCIFDFTSLSLK
jgi:hypothetical protein